MLPVNNSLDFLPNQWINWCRLCAKDDIQHNINFLYQNEEYKKNEIKNFSIQEALSKIFSVRTSIDDNLPKMLCKNCLTLVTSMISFNERVERVQLMFLHLVSIHNSKKSLDLNTIRLKFDVLESERYHWFNIYALDETTCNNLPTNETKKQISNDRKYNLHIKLENVEQPVPFDYEEIISEDAALENDEVVSDNNLNDSLKDDDDYEDPFESNETTQKSSSAEEDIHQLSPQSTSSKSESDTPKTKPVRSMRKRKKLKSCSGIDKKNIKTTIKDFKVEANCTECGQNFTKYTLYREHMQQHHNQSRSEKHWPCPACDKILFNIYNLERHVRLHVPLEVRQKIKCPECDNRYTSNAQLETHIRYKHKNEKKFICEECGLCLRTNSNLRQHMLIHTDIAPFECEVCKKKFKNSTRLKTHMDIHSPTKHICNVCGLQLNSRATLNRHFLVHSDDMQHKCDYCGKAFKRAKALKNHLLLHTGLKPYSCDFCERTFANGSNCRSHMKKIHPDELALFEASGSKTHTKNIPKLETLKAVTKAADNLTPVVTKLSGCFAFGKKPKESDTISVKASQRVKNDTTNSKSNSAIDPHASTPLNLQYMPLAGTVAMNSCLPDTKNLENGMPTTTPIPNFDNIYQHLLKQNQTGLHIKHPLSQISSETITNNISTPHHNPFYQDIIDHTLKPSIQPNDDLLQSSESQNSSMTTLTHDDHSNASLIQATFYGSIRPTLPPDNFM